MSTNSPSQDLTNLLITRDFEVNTLDSKTGRPPVNERGQPDPSKADNFTFEYVAPSGKNYGTVEILLGAENNMLIASGDNTARAMESEDKQDWFDFLGQLRNFAKRNLLTFDVTNFNLLKYSKQGQAALTEGFTGNKHYSFSGQPTEARLMIKHSKIMREEDARFRHIDSIFIETAENERFKLKTRSLVEARAQLQHVREGGRPWDPRGQHISEMVEQAKVLSQFRRAHHGKVLEGAAQQLVNETETYYTNLRHNLKSMSTRSGYNKYFESWNPDTLTEQDMVVEDLKDLFIETRIDPRIEQALPLLAQIKETHMKEADIFEAWADTIVEGTWALPDSEEQKNQLKMLMSKPLTAGSDGLNATEQLYDLVGDDQLFDLIDSLAEANPDANIWEDDRIISRLEELGFEVPTTTPTAPAEEPPAPDLTNQEPAPMNESVMGEADLVIQDLVNGELDAYNIMNHPTTPSEQYVSKIMQDMYNDVSIDRGLHPDDDFEQILDIVIERLAHDYGHSPDVDEGENLATFEGILGTLGGAALGGLLGPIGAAVGAVGGQELTKGGSSLIEDECNHTMEGEECPVHGLEECNMFELQTPGAIGFFNEELARLKALALLK